MMRFKIYVIGAIVIAVVCIVWGLYNQNVPASVSPSQGSGAVTANAGSSGDSSGVTLPPSTLPVGKDGLIKAVIPKNLFGGGNMTAEDYIKEFHDDPDANQILAKLISNDDGTVTVLCTPKQLEKYRQNLYNYSQFQEDPTVPQDLATLPSVKKTIYGDNMLTKITVLVDSKLYEQTWLDRLSCNILLACSAGTYQILSGTPPDKWHTTITIKDASTGKVISTTDFPNADMYKDY